MRLDARSDFLGEAPEIGRLLRGEVREPRDDPPGDHEHVPGNHGLEVDETEGQGRLVEDLRGWDVDGAELVLLRV